jgi:hypothetical protein
MVPLVLFFPEKVFLFKLFQNLSKVFNYSNIMVKFLKLHLKKKLHCLIFKNNLPFWERKELKN